MPPVTQCEFLAPEEDRQLFATLDEGGGLRVNVLQGVVQDEPVDYEGHEGLRSDH